ncbi:MAG: hypothetical protein HOP23_07445 [Methylococcaceae bacterium]|nr:hypothetical protein [Methylococcaceae bacterium]
MISSRYAGPVAIILALATIPTVIHNYLGLTKDDGVTVKTINPIVENFTSSPSKRNAGYGEETFGSKDWLERIYTNNEGKSVRLFIVKGYDHKRLYHHPELALSYAKDLRSRGQIHLDTNPGIPVNLLKNDNRPNTAAFALFYDGKFISNPIKHQILDSLNMLISPKKPMVLFYVSDDNPPQDNNFNQTVSALLITKAIEDYQSNLTATFK